ncbi:MAG: response regulator transcription factor [Planctomyces sp.]|nr:response regulator transcription factor [Planctomyces sp.]
MNAQFDAAASVVQALFLDSDRLLGELLASPSGGCVRVRFLPADSNPLETLSRLTALQPDVVAAGEDVFESEFRALFQLLPVRLGRMQIAVFADRLSDSQLVLAIQLGASGLLSRKASLSELRRQLERIAGGDFIVAAPIADRVERRPGEARPHVPRAAGLAQLSDRQLELLVELLSGESIRELSSRLGMTEKSLESHRTRIMAKLGFSNRVQLCRWAIREGLLRP